MESFWGRVKVVTVCRKSHSSEGHLDGVRSVGMNEGYSGFGPESHQHVGIHEYDVQIMSIYFDPDHQFKPSTLSIASIGPHPSQILKA